MPRGYALLDEAGWCAICDLWEEGYSQSDLAKLLDTVPSTVHPHLSAVFRIKVHFDYWPEPVGGPGGRPSEGPWVRFPATLTRSRLGVGERQPERVFSVAELGCSEWADHYPDAAAFIDKRST